MSDKIQAKAAAGQRVVLAGVFLNLFLSAGKIFRGYSGPLQCSCRRWCGVSA